MTRLRTYDNLENWVATNSRNGKLKVDGTYQYAVFRFVAVQRAYYLATYCVNNTVINLFLDGVPRMDEAEVQKWLDFTIERLTEEFCGVEDWDLDVLRLSPDEKQLLNDFIDTTIETRLKNYFYIR